MRRTLTAIAIASATLMAVPASAAMYQFNVALDGLQEVPPVATPGTGSAVVDFDSVTGAMSVLGSFSGLIGTANNAHIHGYEPAGTPAGVVFGLSFTAATSGTISGNGVIPGARINDVLNGLTYINLHSTFRPGGEIRGQLVDPVLIPEPATLALLATGGLVGAVMLRRRRG